jgi:protein SCO1
MSRRRTRGTAVRRGRSTLAWTLAGFAALGAAVIVAAEIVRPPAAADAAILDRFALVDQDGRAVSDATYRGKWLLVYFGYTHCPDACPTVLNDMAEALDGLGDSRARVQPLFITVDPQRDTPAVLKGYTAAFQADIVGLTGSSDQIAQAAKNFRIHYEREAAASGDYAMAHSSVIYLMDPTGRLVTRFSDTAAPDAIRTALRRALS